jgi:hypothetical protein
MYGCGFNAFRSAGVQPLKHALEPIGREWVAALRQENVLAGGLPRRSSRSVRSSSPWMWWVPSLPL